MTEEPAMIHKIYQIVSVSVLTLTSSHDLEQIISKIHVVDFLHTVKHNASNTDGSLTMDDSN